VITNDFMIAKNLEDMDSIQIVLLGGIVKQGACVADNMLAETKRSMVEHANQVIIVCDHTSLAQFAPLTQHDTIVLDRLPEDAADYQQAGIALMGEQGQHLAPLPPYQPGTSSTLVWGKEGSR
jgi:DeoR family fructose operon transcriptional repressor